MAPSTLHMLIFGGLSWVSASFLMYFMFWRKRSVPAIKDKKEDKTVEKAADQVEKHAKQQPEVVKKAAPAPVPEVVVDDVDSDEDEEEEAEVSSTVDVELEELKTKYEDANRLASKLISGQSYEKAVAKLTEAIELAPQIPNAGKDIMTLYNNRSAMYEKLNLYDKSLSDITVILTMDAFHMKARVRRARVFEAQEKPRQALDEYVFAALQEQRTGAPPSHQLKIDTLAKTLALKGTPALFKSLRQSSTKRPLPSKSHCKNFLESYPSVHLWIEHFKSVQRADLVAAVAAAEAEIANAEATTDAVARDTALRGAQLTLIAFDLVNSRFESAFESLHSMKAATADPLLPTDLNVNVAVRYVTPYDNTDTMQLLSLQYELIGFEAQLRCDLPAAITAFTTSLQFCPGNYDTRLKLGNVYLEQPNLGECSRVFEEMLAHLRTLEQEESSDKEVVAILKAWTLLHRVSLFVTRNDKGEFSPTAIADSQRDVEEALTLTEALQDSLAGKAARVTALIRSVHIVVQSKPMVGEAVSEEDADKSKAAVAAAKLLAPYNDSVMMIDAELLNNEGRADEALALIVAAQLRPDAVEGDCTPYCLRASILINKAMTLFQTATSQEDYNVGQASLKESEGLYRKALELEPQAIEALNQYAQYCGMMGELATAVDLLKQALPLARTRDDVHDLNQVLILNEAQLKAVEAMKSVLNM